MTDIIVERGESPVLVQITKNKGAAFSQTGLGALAQKARKDGELLSVLGKRNDLPADLMNEIKQRVAQKIKSEMAGKYSQSDMADLDSLVDESAAKLDIDGFRKSNDEMQDRANRHRLTEVDIVDLAKSRKLSETVHALSVLTGLDNRMISHCLLKAEIAALGIICKANGFKTQTFLTLIQTRIGNDGIAARDVAKAMREYDSLSVGNAKRTLLFLKVRASVKIDEGKIPAQGDGSLWQAHHNVQHLQAKP